MRVEIMVTSVKENLQETTFTKNHKLNSFMEEYVIFNLLQCFKMSATLEFQTV